MTAPTTAPSHECSTCGGKRRPNGLPRRLCCQVCLGAGRISDVRTAEQAMVDAEALETISGIDVAARCGLRAATYMAKTWAHGADIHSAWQSAVAAARAAFRAVPMLRDDE